MRRSDERCGACGTARSAAARFCGRCGSALPPRARRRPSTRGRRPRWWGVVAGLSAAATVTVTVTVTGGGPSLGTGRSPGFDDRAAVTLPTLDDPTTDRTPADPAGPVDEDHRRFPERDGRACAGPSGPVACVRWTADLGVAEPRAVVHRDHIVLVAEQDGRIRGLATADGIPRWRFTAAGPVRFHDTVATTVPVTGGGTTTFLDPATGTPIGSFAARIGGTAAVSPWLVVQHDGAIEARTVTGTTSWSLPVPDDALAWLTDNGAYLASRVSLRSDRLVRLSVTTGTARWTHELAGRVAAVHALGTSTLIAVEDTGSGARVQLLDRLGAVLADAPVRGRVAHVTTARDGSAAVVSEGPSGVALLIVDGTSGRVVGPVDLGATISDTLPPAIGPGVVAVAAREPEPHLTVVGRGDGIVRHRFAVPAPLRDLALPGEATLVTISGTTVHAWSLGTGGARWHLDLGAPASVVASLPLLVRSDRTLLALEPDPQRRRHERTTPSPPAEAVDRIGQVRGSTS
jgi:outer membrane protein assembly factor BamB